ncbi:non-ribosomal peptide synthetase/type I polyketide synthase [Pseudoalteromonas luteoviolacea]|uniref:non-ribosomal peptide synthetase/type I polyketide synthase n=1 Tax=Pseudoalteromonas luteoviolacea TaxID=43657 RepID=UPI001B3812EC|nr:non-ribosomal peptide synthetase/type I polyketide synthase [Pseudoalteromonas luteoviolacea]MBQ4839489.1 amino acid adenylation domain-containing protein [Pseudoalteromonas luteoviolacea]
MKTDLVTTLVTLANTRGDDTAYQYFFSDDLPSQTLTYKQLDNRARQIASQLDKQFERGDRALLLYNSGFAFIEAFFACLYAGIVAVPVYPPKKNQNITRLRSIIEDAGAKGVLTSKKVNEIARPLFESESSLTGLSLYTTDAIEADPSNWQPIAVRGQDLAFLQYTSGSTGSPKGVMVSHDNITDNEEMMKIAFGHSSETPIVSWLPHFHDMGLIFGILQPIYIGAPACLMNPTYFLQKPLRWLKLLSEFKGVTSSAPNFAYDLCVDTIKEEELETLDLSHWQSALNGAEPVRAKTLERFYNKFKRCGLRKGSLSPCYGMAETTLFASGGALLESPKVLSLNNEKMLEGLAKIQEHIIDNRDKSAIPEYQAVSSGHAWCDHEIAIVSPDTLLRCQDGEVGEIWVKGASVAKGYWNKPELTKEVFHAQIAEEGDGPYLRTGDLGFLHQQSLFVTGRCKDVLIFRGKNYYPQDIELTVSDSDDALESNGGAAFSIHAQSEERLVIVQQIKRTAIRKVNKALVIEKIISAVVENHGIAPYDVVLIKPGRLCKTSSGKVQRQENKAHYEQARFEALAAFRPEKEQQSQVSEAPVTIHPDAALSTAVCKLLQNIIAMEVGIESTQLDIDASFLSLGVDSMKAVRISGELMELHGIELESTILYEYPNIAQLAGYLCQFDEVKSLLDSSGEGHPAQKFEAELQPNSEITDSQTQAVEQAPQQETDIAIIGMACRYPEASDLDSLWQILMDEHDAITTPSDARQQLCPQVNANRFGGYVEGISEFDHAVFGISPSEAQHIDPQQRLLLENTYHAIQSAGYMPSELAEQRIGVYVGISQSDYFSESQQAEKSSAYLGTGTALSIAANRLSYYYNFTGPSLAIDTACSSSLVALHHAVQAIRAGDIKQALVAGVNLILNDDVSQACDNAQMLASDGRCKTFSDSANGYVRSEGVGSILIKPLSQAIADKDPIYGVIKGSAVNQDGRSNGITAPNGRAQQQVIKAALAHAGVEAQDIHYVEAHGTGTELGDPIEVSALQRVYGQQRQNKLIVGSVKANIGHLESAAGLAGLIKTMLCMTHQKIPAQRYSEKLNSHIAWDKCAITVPKEATNWPVYKNKLALAAVSSFGFGGTNAHVILAPSPQRTKPNRPTEQANFYVLPLSAKSPHALSRWAHQYAERLQTLTSEQFDRLVYQAATAPVLKGVKKAFYGTDREALVQQLTLCAESDIEQRNTAQYQSVTKVFLFTGQGSQYPDMGKSLYASQAVFKAAIDECETLLSPYFDERLTEVLYQDQHGQLLNQIRWTQVAIFAVEYAMAKTLLSLGTVPDVLISHSVGEYAAACIAGVMSLADTTKLIATRAQLMHELDAGGKMIAARCTKERAHALIAAYCQDAAISGYHGEAGVVFSGSDNAIAQISEELARLEIRVKELNTGAAFHSPLMRPMLDEFAKVLDTITLHKPTVKFISSVTGKAEGTRLTQPEYWCEQIVEPVCFDACLSELGELASMCVVELGPKPILSALAQENLPQPEGAYLHVLHDKGCDRARLGNSIATFYELGMEVEWAKLYPSQSQHDSFREPLPLYPFDQHTHWVGATDTVVRHNPVQTQVASNDLQRTQAIEEFVLSTLAKELGMSTVQIDPHLALLEMGVDSLMIMRAVRIFEKQFDLEFSVRQFYEELSNVTNLVNYIAQHSDYLTQVSVDEQSEPSVSVQPSDSVATTTTHVESNVIVSICQAQLQAAASVSCETAQQSVSEVTAQQLSWLSQHPQNTRLQVGAEASNTEVDKLNSEPPKSSSKVKATSAILPGFQSKQLHHSAGTKAMRQHSETLSAQYCEKTATSKQLIAQHRAQLADCRASAGFRLSSKEMLYPIYAQRCEGSRIWDIDDNEYIDITMDFGVNLFGHKPAFITEALSQQLNSGIQLGLASPLACEAASLISELTGLERVSFCNSGTEAVMTALRLARNKTKRHLVVQFEGAYHGHFDGTLAAAAPGSDGVEPMCSGVRQGAIDDNLVLKYGDESALEQIKANGHNIAAVLVEPVQSRHPDLQPFEFLKQLRALTQSLGIALIFDEMITGFRAHPGGVQRLLGVQADIATYGKIVGGGLPIGVVAGSAEYLDGIDGGMWQYGDNSFPEADTTFFAGTFCKHPLSMASAVAVLKEIKRQGTALQAALEHKTSYLRDTLNVFFAQHDIPISITSFSSLFRFQFSQNLDVFFYELLNRGVFIWEGRNCFISASHSDEDIEFVIDAVKGSALALKGAGYFGQQHSVVVESDELDRVNRTTDPVALTQGQKQLLALALRSDNGALAYHLQASIGLSGTLDIERLKRAVQHVMQAFPQLSFGVDINELMHVARATPELELCRTEHPLTLQNAQRQLTELRYRHFAIERDALCRVCLLSDGDQQHYLSVIAHHIVCDGISLQIILASVAQYYSDGEGVLSADAPDYGAYVQALASYENSATQQKDEVYWHAQLAGSEQLALPLKRAAKAQSNLQTKSLRYALSEHAIQNLQGLAKSQGCGLFATLLACYMVWLQRLSQQNRIAVNIPVSDRQLLSPEFDADVLDEQLVGYCTNMLPLQIDIDLSLTFGALLSQVQAQLLDALEHQHYPYSQLCEQAWTLPNTVFNFDRVQTLPKFAGLDLTPIANETHFGQFDLSCNILNIGEQWWLELDYQSDRFDEEMISSYARTWLAMTELITIDQTLSSDVLALHKCEVHHALNSRQLAKSHSFSDDASLIELLSEQVSQTPQRVAVQDDICQLSYQGLATQSNQLANYLIQQGIGKGSLVAVAMSRSAKLVVTLLAVLKTGAAYLPIDVSYPQARVKEVLADSQANLLLCDAPCAEIKTMTDAHTHCIDIDFETESIDSCQSTPPSRSVESEQRAYVIYTSGSSGRPKGVEITHGALSNFLVSMQNKPGIAQHDRVLAITTTAFDIAALELFLPLISGASVVVASEAVCSDPLAIAELIEREQISYMQATPTLWQLLIKAAPSCVSNLTVLCGGEPLDKSLAGSLLAQDANVWNMYGPTETTIWSSVACITDENDITIGDGIANTGLLVMPEQSSDDSVPLPTGVWGELWITGAGLALGYLNRKALTAQSFVSHSVYGQVLRCYKTGDRARRLPDGRIELQGRLDSQVKLHGHRIELAEIEYQLRKLLGQDDVRVLVKTTEQGSAHLCAFCLSGTRQDVQWEYSAIRQHLMMKLPSYMVPEYVSWLSQWPRTPNGKIDTQALLLPQLSTEQEVRYRAPETALEKSLHEFFVALLPVEKLSVDSSFFDCGGNSVLAMQLVSRVNRNYSVRCTVADIFDFSSISLLAQRLTDLQSSAQTGPDATQVEVISDIVSGRDISAAFDDQSMTEMDL